MLVLPVYYMYLQKQLADSKSMSHYFRIKVLFVRKVYFSIPFHFGIAVGPTLNVRTLACDELVSHAKRQL